MSGRYKDYDKGSSRSARDDSRRHKERSWASRERDGVSTKSRSRSPNRCPSPPSLSRSSKYAPERSTSSRGSDDRRRDRSPVWEEDSEEEVPAPPPPPRISKISIGFSKPSAPIKMSLGVTKSAPSMPKPSVASVFNADDDDDEPEEMPAEAKMRMRNIGRETPTSAGPNSFGKTKQGFCDAKKVFEKNLKQALDTVDKPGGSAAKFPQTIYKLKGP